LQTLREKLRCKEIWVVAADRYRNPDDDLPADFEPHRGTYYEALRLPLDAESHRGFAARNESRSVNVGSGAAEEPARQNTAQKQRLDLSVTA